MTTDLFSDRLLSGERLAPRYTDFDGLSNRPRRGIRRELRPEPSSGDRPLCPSSAVARLAKRAESGMAALEHAGPGSRRSYRLLRTAGIDPTRSHADLRDGPVTGPSGPGGTPGRAPQVVHRATAARAVFASLKAFGRECQSAAGDVGCRRSRSTLAIAAGPGHSSTSHWGSGSFALLNASISSSSPRPFGNKSSARGIS
jgi:hypothetical protein